jgi:hypothetical protein
MSSLRFLLDAVVVITAGERAAASGDAKSYWQAIAETRKKTGRTPAEHRRNTGRMLSTTVKSQAGCSVP